MDAALGPGGRILLDELPAFVTVAAADGTIVYWNRGWRLFTGHPEGDSHRRWRESIHPDDLVRAEEAWANAVARGDDTVELQYRVREAASGRYRWVRSIRTAVRTADGRVDHYVGVALPNDDYNEVVRLQAQFQALVDANIIGIVTVDGNGDFRSGNDEFLRMTGYSRDELLGGPLNWWNITPPQWKEQALKAEAELRARRVFTPFEKEFLGKDGRRVPVLIGGALLPGSEVDEICYVLDLTETKRAQSRLESGNAQLARARDRERSMAERLRALADCGRALSATLELDVVLDAAASAAVPHFADWALINVWDETGEIVVAAARHADPGRDRHLRSLVGRSYLLPCAPAATTDVFRTGKLVHHAALSDAVLEADVKPEWLELFRSMSPRSSVTVPLVVGGRVFGTLNLNYSESGRSYQTDDLNLLADIGFRAASAIENARRYEHERRIASRLQRAFLPSRLPKVPWAALDALYVAAHEEDAIGGDWYDAFLLTDGRLVVSVGDVVGRGLDAAVTMGSVRQAIRGAAQASSDPVAVLDAVDRGFGSKDGVLLATVFLGILDPFDATLTYATAGHPLPAVRTAQGVLGLEAHGLPLGIRSRTASHRRSGTVVLGEGATLVLYTDGLTEATRDIAGAEKRLEEALERLSEEYRPAHYVRRYVLDRQVGHARDDIAILTVRLLGDDASPWKLQWTFDFSDARTVAVARSTVRDALQSCGAAENDLRLAEFIVGELTSNVVRYAPGLADVALDMSGAAPILHVLDRGGPLKMPARQLNPLGEGGLGLFLVSNLANGLSLSARPGGGTHARAVLTASGARARPPINPVATASPRDARERRA